MKRFLHWLSYYYELTKQVNQVGGKGFKEKITDKKLKYSLNQFPSIIYLTY